MKRRSFDESEEKPSNALPFGSSSLLCRMPDCGRRWSVDIGHGRVCSMHDEMLSRESICKAPASVRSTAPRPLPTLGEAVKPFVEVDDEEKF